MYPRAVQKLIEKFSKFPTVGPRGAARFVFYLLKLSESEFDEFTKELQKLKRQIELCRACFNPYDIAETSQENKLCSICSNAARDAILCIVEKESDLETLESSKLFNGYYFVLGGTVASQKNSDIKNVRLEELKKRIEKPDAHGFPCAVFKEIVIATNPTTEGEATALYIIRLCSSFHIPTTRLARGLPVGAELEYADEETLRSALEGRK